MDTIDRDPMTAQLDGQRLRHVHQARITGVAAEIAGVSGVAAADVDDTAPAGRLHERDGAGAAQRPNILDVEISIKSERQRGGAMRRIQVLSRGTKNNPVLIGEPGVGKDTRRQETAVEFPKYTRPVQAALASSGFQTEASKGIYDVLLHRGELVTNFSFYGISVLRI